MIPFLLKIDESIQSESSPTVRAELLAAKASYLSRLGRSSEASAVLTDLRQEFGGGAFPEVLISIILAEGVSHYFRDLSDQSYERVLRAFALGRAFGAVRQLQLSSSWLAHLELERSNYLGMVAALQACFAAGEGDRLQDEAKGRAAIVLGDAFLLVGDRRRSQDYYVMARLCALNLGDRVGIGAIMFNRASFGISWGRATAHMSDGFLSAEVSRLLLREIQSSIEYQKLTEVTALDHLSYVMLARAQLLCGQFEEALNILEPLVEGVLTFERRTKRTPIVADAALCMAECGRRQDALRLLSDVQDVSFEKLDADDQLIVAGTLAQLSSKFGLDVPDMDSHEKLRMARERYAQDVSSLSSALQKLHGATD